jgi:hypothetical protein
MVHRHAEAHRRRGDRQRDRHARLHPDRRARADGAQPNGWWALFLFGFMNGFTADSALNKATRAAWTPEERALAKAQP